MQQYQSDPSTEQDQLPLVSLGLPVFNGQNYISAALDSIVSQTYQNLEVIIVDNASEDRTVEICNAYVNRDNRFRLICNHQNRGAAYSFNRSFEESRGSLFKWVAHDDLFDPRFIEKCVERLQEDPKIVWCFSQTTIITEDDQYHHKGPSAVVGNPERVSDRLWGVLQSDNYCFDIFGLIRSNCLRRTRLLGPYPGSDRILRAELAIQGGYEELDESLFFIRDHSERSVRAMPTHQQRRQWFDTSVRNRVSFPFWRILGEYFSVIGRHRLTLALRLACWFQLFRWITIERHWARMISDLLIAAFPSSWKLLLWLGQIGKRNPEAVRQPQLE